MAEENIFEILKDNREICSLPQVLAEVVRVSDDEASTASEIADVIMKDPALTARMLRISNSAYYGRGREVTTINQAVVTLGIRAVKAMALSSGIYGLFEIAQPVADRMRFWRHSLEVAIACREIAEICSYRPAEEAFIAGLLHDIGILVLESNFGDQFRRIWKLVESGESLVKLEESTWGTNHSRVAQFLLAQWKLPSLLGEAISKHHADFEVHDDIPANRLARIVALGNLISKFRICQGPPLNPENLARIDRLSESLGIGPTVLAETQEKTLGMLIKESKFLDIEIGSIPDLLESANRLIYKQYLLVESTLRENRQMQSQLAREQMKKAALDSLKTITATLSHYINNASATILGRAQLVELALQKGRIKDDKGMAEQSMGTIVRAVETISLVLDELKKLSSFDITHYHDETSILDIEDKLKGQIEALDKSNAENETVLK